MKELGDVMNDLSEAYNMLEILAKDRAVLQDKFALAHVQTKGLQDLNKNLSKELTLYDSRILPHKIEGTPRYPNSPIPPWPQRPRPSSCARDSRS